MNKALIIDNSSVHIDEINRFLCDFDTEIKSYDDPSILDTSEDTLVVLSGGRDKSIIGHQVDFENEIQLIRKFAGPILGICLGFEMIAHAHGAQLIRNPYRTEGNVSVYATTRGRALGIPGEAHVYEAHRWVLPSGGDDIETLAISDSGIEIIKVKDRPHYGAQFHPEIDNGTDGHRLFKILVNLALYK